MNWLNIRQMYFYCALITMNQILDFCLRQMVLLMRGATMVLTTMASVIMVRCARRLPNSLVKHD